MVNDTLGHIFSAMRNGYINNKFSVRVNVRSKLVFKVLEVLKQAGLIQGFSCYGRGKGKPAALFIFLKYAQGTAPLIKSISRMSSPGRKMYVSLETLTKAQSKSVCLLLSTPVGLLTDAQAIAKNHGGVLLCKFLLH